MNTIIAAVGMGSTNAAAVAAAAVAAGTVSVVPATLVQRPAGR